MEKSYLHGRVKSLQQEVAEECVKWGRDPKTVALMAVTKTRTPEEVNAVMEAGMNLAGENRVQELLKRQEAYGFGQEKIHFIGQLQTNKVKSLLPYVSTIESLDSVRLAKEIDRCSRNLGIIMPCYVEININGEGSKGGILPEDLSGFLEEMGNFPHLKIKGLMTIGAKENNNEKKADNFQKMQRLFIDNKDKKIDNIDISVLSMGMTEDYLLAVRFGSNLIRLGRKLFI